MGRLGQIATEAQWLTAKPWPANFDQASGKAETNCGAQLQCTQVVATEKAN